MVYIFSITGAVLGFSLNIILARTLTLAELDKVKYLVALITTLSNIFVVGLPSFITREANRISDVKKMMSKCYTFFFLVSLFVIPIVFFILSNYTVYTSGNITLSILVIIISILMGILTLIASLLLGERKYKSYYFVETVFPKLLLVILCSLFIVIGLTNKISQSYLLFYLFIYLVLDIFFILKQFRSFSLSFTRNEIVTISVFFGTTIAQVLVSSLSPILQSNMFPDVVGVTSIIATSTLLMSVVNVFTNVLSSILKPHFAKAYIDQDDSKILDYYRFGTRTNLYFSIPVYLFFIVFPAYFLSVFSENLAIYPYVLSIVALTQMLSSLCGTTGALLSMVGEEKKQFMNVVIQFFVFIICIFIFRHQDIYGIVISTLISEITITVIKFLEVGLKYKTIPLDIKTVISVLLMIAADFLVVFGFSFLHIDNILVWFCIAIPLGIVILVLNVVLTPYGKNDFMRLVRFKGGEINEGN